MVCMSYIRGERHLSNNVDATTTTSTTRFDAKASKHKGTGRVAGRMNHHQGLGKGLSNALESPSRPPKD